MKYFGMSRNLGVYLGRGMVSSLLSIGNDIDTRRAVSGLKIRGRWPMQ